MKLSVQYSSLCVTQIRDWVESYPYYAINFYNYVDWILISLHISALAMTVSANIYLKHLDYNQDDRFIDIRSAVEAEQVGVEQAFRETITD